MCHIMKRICKANWLRSARALEWGADGGRVIQILHSGSVCPSTYARCCTSSTRALQHTKRCLPSCLPFCCNGL